MAAAAARPTVPSGSNSASPQEALLLLLRGAGRVPCGSAFAAPTYSTSSQTATCSSWGSPCHRSSHSCSRTRRRPQLPGPLQSSRWPSLRTTAAAAAAAAAAPAAASAESPARRTAPPQRCRRPASAASRRASQCQRTPLLLPLEAARNRSLRASCCASSRPRTWSVPGRVCGAPRACLSLAGSGRPCPCRPAPRLLALHTPGGQGPGWEGGRRCLRRQGGLGNVDGGGGR